MVLNVRRAELMYILLLIFIYNIRSHMVFGGKYRRGYHLGPYSSFITQKGKKKESPKGTIMKQKKVVKKINKITQRLLAND